MLYSKIRKTNKTRQKHTSYGTLNTLEKKCVFSKDLNSASVEADLTCSGRVFHSLGLTTAKVRSPLRFKRDCGTVER